MRIERVEAIPFRIPLGREVRWGAVGRRNAQEHVLVRVYSDSGAVGTAEAIPRPTIYGETQESVVEVITRYLAPLLVGRNPFAREEYWAAMDTVRWNPTAKAALDIAIHDLIARELSMPLVKLLGGSVRPVPFGYMVGLGTVAELRQEVEEIVTRFGIRAFKVKAGKNPTEDISRVKELRSILGDDGFIFIDANQLYSPEVAIRTINEMAEYGLAMVEEPIPIHQDQQRKRVAGAIPVPILADESVATVPDARRELERGAIGVMGIKPPRTGILDSIKILHLAEAFGVPCWVGCQGVSGVGTLASAHFAAAFGRNIPFPADLGTFLKQEDDLLEEPPVVIDGAICLSERPGTGGCISEEKLQRYRVDR